MATTPMNRLQQPSRPGRQIRTAGVALAFAAALTGIGLGISLPSSAGIVTDHGAVLRRILKVHIALPPKILSVDPFLSMEQRSREGSWDEVSKVSSCFVEEGTDCESRIDDPGPIVPAVPGRLAKHTAYYRLVFQRLPAGIYRFTGLAYYRQDGVVHVLRFTSRAYRIGQK
jgi:hypothetical protein